MVQTTASAERVEVGAEFEIELSAMSDSSDSPSDPRLGVPPAFHIAGPTIGTQQRISFVNGSIERQTGITATWQLVATQPGRFTLGPPSVAFASGRVRSNAVQIEVVPAGTLPAPTRRRRGGLFDDPFDSFDPFSLLPQLPHGPPDDTDSLLGGGSNAPDEYRVEHAPDPMAFLRAEVVPNRAVVGEQVTLRVYAYGGRGPYDEVNTSEPSRADFLSRVLIENSYRQPQYRIVIDNQSFFVVKVREVALFPLRAGTLRIGPMRMGFRGRGYPSPAVYTGLVRNSVPLDVIVTEPPIAGRPPGYRIGDVGSFRLSATVEPRSVRSGEAVRVVATLEGTGNLPSELMIPERKGVEWSEARTTDTPTVNASIIGGTRKFAYVVRLDQPGHMDLGEISLPYFDPRQGRYDVARAPLGAVDVTGTPVRPDVADDKDKNDHAHVDPLAGLLTVRGELGPAPQSQPRWLDRPWFWALLTAGPLGVLAISGASELSRRARQRWQRRRQSQPAQAKEALKEARRAAEAGNAAAAATNLEKAVYASIEGSTGLRARGVLRSDLASKLTERGVSEGTAEQISRILDDCENVRFTGEAGVTLADLCARAEQVTGGLRAKKISVGGRV